MLLVCGARSLFLWSVWLLCSIFGLGFDLNLLLILNDFFRVSSWGWLVSGCGIFVSFKLVGVRLGVAFLVLQGCRLGLIVLIV